MTKPLEVQLKNAGLQAIFQQGQPKALETIGILQSFQLIKLDWCLQSVSFTRVLSSVVGIKLK